MDAAFAKIETGSPPYRAALTLRAAVLRAPLGLTLTEEELARDAGAHHFVALDGEAVIASVGLYPDRPGVMRLRQMAVAPERQGGGLGAALLNFAEDWARGQNVARIETHARATARGFYDRAGYRADGAPFSEQGIPHVLMWKALVDQSA